MRNLSKRVSALEVSMQPPVTTFWHWIIQDLGQTEDEARVAYESENGPIGDDDCIIWRVVV